MSPRLRSLRLLGPSGPDFVAFPSQPELRSVEVGQPQITGARGFPNLQRRVARFILVRTRIAQLFRSGWDCRIGLRRIIQVNRHGTIVR